MGMPWKTPPCDVSCWIFLQEELTGGYALNNVYVWHITNPSEVLNQGFKVSKSIDLYFTEAGRRYRIGAFDTHARRM